MDEVLARFFKSINYEDKDNCFKDSVIEKVYLKEKTEEFEVIIINKKPVDIEAIIELLEYAKAGINQSKKVKIKFKNETVSEGDIVSYLTYFLKHLAKDRPSLVLALENEIQFNEGHPLINVASKSEKEELTRELKKILKEMASLGIETEVLVNIVKDDSILTKEEVILEREEESNLILGKEIKKEKSSINDVLRDGESVCVEAFVFGIESKELEKINIITLKISDNTNSILAKIFKKDKETFRDILRKLKVGSWFRLEGSVEFDNFAKDLVLNVRSVEKINSKDRTLKDEAPLKRVELHLHTFMSAMDSVVDQTKLLKFIKELGHNAVAVTDHNSLQAYPEIFNNLKYLNNGLTDEEKIKVLYGAELSIVQDDADLIFNLQSYHLLEDEFVVFDTETTGFYAGRDQMIEIGAVKIKGGTITDRFDELIACPKPLPSKITELTNITDAMLKGKRSEEEVLKDFLEWTGSAPMVAHNAKFDISFLKEACHKYLLEDFNNTVIDTMNLARILNPEWSNHKLQTLTKKYDIPWDEDAHHRADYDAQGTALAFHKMAKILNDRNIETTVDLDNSIDKDELIKFSHPFHLCVLVKNSIGLKNLFKIISLASTKYLFKNNEPKLPRKELIENRLGLLIGSGCINGEVFEKCVSLEDEEIANMMRFYDYIEIQPPSAMLQLVGDGKNAIFKSLGELHNYLQKLIRIATDSGVLVCATGDVHNLRDADLKTREIIVNQKMNGRLHPLNREGMQVPNMKFLTTEEMLEEFSFLGDELAFKIVVENTRKIADEIEFVEIIKDKLFTPEIPDSDKITKDMVYKKAYELYGNPLPLIVEERIEKELKGIIDNGYSVLYMIAQKLVQKSNEDGYFVGSRGSVGSSFVATMMNITEVNGLPAHYLCPKCKKSIFEDENGSFKLHYRSGYDLKDKICECGTMMRKEGQDMPFATFLGFNAEKVPDIDLNFSGEYQAKAHDYTKVLFGEDKVFRAGTIGTVADKTAFGYVKGYCENKGIILRGIEIERLAQGCIGVKRTTGQHPGGIIVIPAYKDIFDFTAYQYPAEDMDARWFTTHFDFHAIHDNVLKLDILGHDDPTMLKRLADTTGVDILTIPFDDAKVLSLFRGIDALGIKKGSINATTGTLGIPEFGTNFVIKMLEETKPTTFAELVKISGLSHGTDVWNNNARDLILNNVVPFKDIIGCRDDILTDLINYGVQDSEAFKISEFVRKGKPSVEPDKWAQLTPIMEEVDVPEWYITSCSKIKYMFPKAHATAYVMMALRVAWFKVYKPLFYYSAFFSIRCSDFDVESMLKGEDGIRKKLLEISSKGYETTNKEDAIATTLNVALEMCVRGYKFKNIDLLKSEASTFVIEEETKSLILPFITLDGLGESVGASIVKAREEKAFLSIEDLQSRGHLSSALVLKMRALHILDKLPETSQVSIFELI